MATTNVHRRKFLTAVGLGGAAAAAAAVAARRGAERREPEPGAGRQDKGYQLTDHVRKYYRTTQV